MSSEETQNWVDFLQIQQALMILPVVVAIGSLCFFYASLHYAKDLQKVEDALKVVDSNILSSVDVSDSEDAKGKQEENDGEKQARAS